MTISQLILEGLRYSKLSRVAVMGDADSLNEIPKHLGGEYLDSRRDYHWSGVYRRPGFERRPPRVLMGDYTGWFQWYMSFQRFRAFQTVILIDPFAAVVDEETGGFVDGLLARLMQKVPQIVIISKGKLEQVPTQPKKSRVSAVLLALLYGTRLSKAQLIVSVRNSLIPIPDTVLQQALDSARWSTRRNHSRYELSGGDRKLVQGMTPVVRWKSEDEPEEIEQLFERMPEHRYVRPQARWIESQAMSLAKRTGWFTIQTFNQHLQKLFENFARSGAPPPADVYPYAQRDRTTETQIFIPSPSAVRRVCSGLVASGHLSNHVWYREIGRPTLVYAEPETPPPFNDEARCGQCAFYVSARRRCRLWWLANKKQVFYDKRWKREGSHVADFEIHKMKYASRIGPHSSACLQFLDKKRDHLRKAIPDKCEICGEAIQVVEKPATTCQNCNTRYVRWKGKAKVLTAYEHEFRRRYHEVTGGNAIADLEAWTREMKESLRTAYPRTPGAEDLDALAEPLLEPELEPPRIWPQFSQELQTQVDRLASTTDIARQLSLAMARSALNATQRIAAFSELYSGDVDPLVALQEKYIASIGGVDSAKLLVYEALVMRQYWLCFGLALKGVQQWFGPRKRSRFVREFAYDPAGRARGYSPVDAAINYLHQRRLRLAERINAEVGFPGTCDGFLHKERYNSRKIGLPLDMIDPFKFADREELLLVLTDQGLTWKDFKIETDRRGSNFYYPADAARPKLDQIGSAADGLIVRHQEMDMQLKDAYKWFAERMLQSLFGGVTTSSGIGAFTFEPSVG